MDSTERGLSINKGTIIQASKLVLVCVGAISTATLFRAAVIPYVLDLTLSTLPRIWASFRSWVSPFYIYIAVQFIIVAIVVSSSIFHRNAHTTTTTTNNNNNNNRHSHSTSFVLEKANSWESFHIVQEHSPENDKDEKSETEPLAGADEGPPEDQPEDPPEELSGSSSGGESSMDETWKAIMENRRRPERSETVAARLERAADKEAAAAAEVRARKEMRKWETFNDRVTLRKDKSMSPEELSLRSEAFIRKVNADMRLQRLESEQRYMEMVNRGL